MLAANVLNDDDFDALVDRLHSLSLGSPNGEIDRWRIRLLLADSGILPVRVASVPSIVDGLAASLRAICRESDRHDLIIEAA